MKKNLKIVIVLLVCSFMIVGCGKKDKTVDDHINLTKPDNVKVETFYNADQTGIIVKLTNESSSSIPKLDVEANYSENEEFYDGTDVIITNFKPNSTTYAFLSLPFDNNFESYVPDKFDLNITTEGDLLEDVGDVSKYADKLKSTFTVEDNIIDYTITNDTGKKLGTVDSIIVYFKEGKPVGADYITAIDVDTIFNMNRDVLYVGDLDEPQYIDYDNIEVYITYVNDNIDEITDDFFVDGEEETVDEDDDMSWE